MTWKHLHITGPLCGESTGHQWIPQVSHRWIQLTTEVLRISQGFVFSQIIINWGVLSAEWWIKTYDKCLQKHYIILNGQIHKNQKGCNNCPFHKTKCLCILVVKTALYDNLKSMYWRRYLYITFKLYSSYLLRFLNSKFGNSHDSNSVRYSLWNGFILQFGYNPLVCNLSSYNAACYYF